MYQSVLCCTQNLTLTPTGWWTLAGKLGLQFRELALGMNNTWVKKPKGINGGFLKRSVGAALHNYRSASLLAVYSIPHFPPWTHPDDWISSGNTSPLPKHSLAITGISRTRRCDEREWKWQTCCKEPWWLVAGKWLPRGFCDKTGISHYCDTSLRRLPGCKCSSGKRKIQGMNVCVLWMHILLGKENSGTYSGWVRERG